MRLRARVGVLLGTLALAACSATPPATSPTVTGSPAGSGTPSVATTPSVLPTLGSTEAPTAVPTPVPTPPRPTPTPAAALGKLTLAEVRVDSLNVRVSPSGSAGLLDVTDFPSASVPLARGDQVLVLDGPVEAEGYRWYAVGLRQDPNFAAAHLAVGWIAAGTPSNPWLAPASVDCPAPDVTALSAMPAIVRLACYGGDSIGFSAYQAAEPAGGGLGGACLPPAGQPGWLVCDNIGYSWVNADGSSAWLLLLHFDPASGISPTGLADQGTVGPAYAITGHFDDPAAQACATSTSDPSDVTQLGAWLTCASKFVVETLQPVS